MLCVVVLSMLVGTTPGLDAHRHLDDQVLQSHDIAQYPDGSSQRALNANLVSCFHCYNRLIMYEPRTSASVTLYLGNELNVYTENVVRMFFQFVIRPYHEPHKKREIHVAAMDVSPTGLKTWRSVAVLHIKSVDKRCFNGDVRTAPSIAASPSRRELVFFGFGPLPICNRLFIWREGKLIQHATVGEERIQNFLHSIATVEDRSEFENSAGTSYQVIVFGGLLCKGKTNVSEVRNYCTACVHTGDLWLLRVREDTRIPSAWVRVPKSPSESWASLPFLLVPSLNAINSTLLVFAGITNSTTARYHVKNYCSLSMFDFETYTWTHHGEISKVCYLNTVLGYTQVAFVADSTQLLIYNIARRPSYSFMPSREFVTTGADICTVFSDDGRPSCRTLFRDKFSPTALHPTHVVRGDAGVYIGNGHYEVDEILLKFPNLSLNTDNVTEITQFVKEHIYDSKSQKFKFPGSGGCRTPQPVLKNSDGDEQIVFFPGSQCYPYEGTQHARSWWLFNVAMSNYQTRSLESCPRQQTDPNLIGSTTRMSENLVVLIGLEANFSVRVDTGVTTCVNIDGFICTQLNEKGHGSMDAPSPRMHTVTVRISETSLLLYGGLEDMTRKLLSDVWVLTFSNLSACSGAWQKVTPSEKLPPRTGHSSTTINGLHYIFGGRANKSICTNFLTALNVTSQKGVFKVDVIKIPLSPCLPTRRSSAITQYTDNGLLVHGGENRALDKEQLSTSFYISLNFTSISSHGKLQQSKVLPFFRHDPIYRHHIVRATKLFVFSGVSPLHYQKRELENEYWTIDESHYCPLGHHRQTNTTCEPCPVGTFSDSLYGGCTNCPNFTTTDGIGAEKCHALSPCHNFHCNNHGTCTVDKLRAQCKCSFGYTPYDDCRYPLVHIAITSAVTVFAAVVAFGVYKYCRRNQQLRVKEIELQDKHKQLRVAQKKLDQINIGARIQWSSLKPVRTIAKGNFSKVWLAELSDMLVAVKVLPKLTGRNTHTDEFVQEAEVLRSIRHPNIVIFLGAGHNASNKKPFLVMEYLRRGSLYGVLHDASNVFSHHDQLRFALDTAKGMEYLHGSNPPRLHRDLKSPNLLVSDKWVVKIGDLGTSRFMAILDQDNSQRNKPTTIQAAVPPTPRPKGVRRRHSSLDLEDKVSATTSPTRSSNELLEEELMTMDGGDAGETTPLLTDIATNHGETYQRYSAATMTRGVGTLRWKSPESLRADHYNEKTDIYSYGVVLWEIFTRRTPYEHLKHHEDIEKEITSGHQLAIPPGVPYAYRHLVETCLRVESVNRPSFPEIRHDLEVQQVNAAQ